jgi:predicted NAD/FAD-binding protein
MTDHNKSKNKPTLAVVGTGLAGLSAAYLLKNKFDVTVFESHSRAGMGVHTIDYENSGKCARIDVPLRIFCKGYYQNLTALYEHIGVQISGSDHSGVFADGNNRLLFHYGKFTFNGVSVAYPKGRSLVQINTLRIARQLKRFLSNAAKDLKAISNIDAWTFGDYLAHTHTATELTDTILLPQLSVTLTCDYQSVLNYPAELILEYLTCGIVKDGIIGAEKGVDDIVPRLLEGVCLKVNCPVKKIVQLDQKVRVSYGNDESLSFDQVVVASQAHHAEAMLDGFSKQKALLRTVPFESSEMSVHTDSALLPESWSDLSPVSYFIPKDIERPEVTVNLSKAFDRYNGVEHVFQTWNPLRAPRAEKELARVRFTRPIVTLKSRAAMESLRMCQQETNNRLWFCGSYMADKVPLLDAAVDSSMIVAKSLGVRIPWETNA